SLGIGADFDKQMQHLVGTYECEWADVVRDPEKRALFRQFANDDRDDDGIRVGEKRGQRCPDGRPRRDPPHDAKTRRLPLLRRQWVRLASMRDVPTDGGVTARYGDTQIAIFNFASRGTGYATQNLCPHKREMVLARGILGDQAGAPKVACPLHKKTFDLSTGRCLSGEDLEIATFPVRVEGDDILVELPPVEDLPRATCHDAPAPSSRSLGELSRWRRPACPGPPRRPCGRPRFSRRVAGCPSSRCPRPRASRRQRCGSRSRIGVTWHACIVAPHGATDISSRVSAKRPGKRWCGASFRRGCAASASPAESH